jgi:hypothetical protein
MAFTEKFVMSILLRLSLSVLPERTRDGARTANS